MQSYKFSINSGRGKGNYFSVTNLLFVKINAFSPIIGGLHVYLLWEVLESPCDGNRS